MTTPRDDRHETTGYLTALRDDFTDLLVKLDQERSARRSLAKRIERRLAVIEDGHDSRISALERELRLYPEPGRRAVPILDGDE